MQLLLLFETAFIWDVFHFPPWKHNSWIILHYALPEIWVRYVFLELITPVVSFLRIIQSSAYLQRIRQASVRLRLTTDTLPEQLLSFCRWQYAPISRRIEGFGFLICAIMVESRFYHCVFHLKMNHAGKKE